MAPRASYRTRAWVFSHNENGLRSWSKRSISSFGWTLADNHLRGCYGVTGGVGRARKLARARRHRGESGRRRPEGASCEDSDLGSVRH
ncbi:jg1915 [Pararge aegeria aegeria]|uniref:Jg1915 protein n=1 Tax=Pararge aegeria aegeria TaxID=348720 RepID=A0A8S4R9D8_9NEOP|nr:jg1915 [Pararge aegeria aegeria]